MQILKASIIEPYTPSSRKNNKIKDEEKEEITFIIFLMYHSKNYFLTCTSSNFCDVYIYFCDHKIILLKSSKKKINNTMRKFYAFFLLKTCNFSYTIYVCTTHFSGAVDVKKLLLNTLSHKSLHQVSIHLSQEQYKLTLHPRPYDKGGPLQEL